MNPTSPSPSPQSAARPLAATASLAAEGAIDVQALAEKVYRMLLADLSLDMRRSGQTGRGERP